MDDGADDSCPSWPGLSRKRRGPAERGLLGRDTDSGRAHRRTHRGQTWAGRRPAQRAAEKIYRTTDGGHTWQAFAAPRHNVSGLCCGRRQARWAADFRHHHVLVYRTTDEGRRWTVGTTPAPAIGECGPILIRAAG